MDDFGAYLNSLRCEGDGCDRRGDHFQGGKTFCSACLDPNQRAFAAND